MYLFKALTQFFTGNPTPKVPEPTSVKVEEVNNKPMLQEPITPPAVEAVPATAKVAKPKSTRPRGPGKNKKTTTK